MCYIDVTVVLYVCVCRWVTPPQKAAIEDPNTVKLTKGEIRIKVLQSQGRCECYIYTILYIIIF